MRTILSIPMITGLLTLFFFPVLVVLYLMKTLAEDYDYNKELVRKNKRLIRRTIRPV